MFEDIRAVKENFFPSVGTRTRVTIGRPGVEWERISTFITEVKKLTAGPNTARENELVSEADNAITRKGSTMSGAQIQPIHWSEFPNETLLRCQGIADEVEKLGWPRTAIKEYNGSYSFQANIGGGIKTVAKLIPQPPCSDPNIYAGFSPLLPEPEEHARKLKWRVEDCTFMRERFFTSRISADWDERQVAEVIDEFLKQGKPRRGRSVHL